MNNFGMGLGHDTFGVGVSKRLVGGGQNAMEMLMALSPTLLLKFDEASGPAVTDHSGFNRHATATAGVTFGNPSIVKDVGSSIYMDGNEGINDDLANNWNPGTARSFHAIVDLDSLAGSPALVYHAYGGGVTIFSDGRLYCTYFIGSWRSWTTPGPVVTTGRRHISITYDKANIKYFVDGVRVFTAAQTGNAGFSSGSVGVWRYGVYYSGAANYLTGKYGLFAWFPIGLTEDQVAEHYAALLP